MQGSSGNLVCIHNVKLIRFLLRKVVHMLSSPARVFTMLQVVFIKSKQIAA